MDIHGMGLGSTTISGTDVIRLAGVLCMAEGWLAVGRYLRMVTPGHGRHPGLVGT